jgi:hypothetical protein
VVLGGLDFTILRILIVALVLRTYMRGEVAVIHWNRFDKLVFAWTTCGAIVFSLQMASTGGIINRCGVMFDVLGTYWLCRQCIRSWAGIKTIMMIFAICLLVFAPLVGFEWAMGQNPFAALGRVSTWVREERYRCQASFVHSIAMGLFWATLLPMFISMAMIDKRKILYWIATVLCVFCILGSASASPLGTLLVVALLFPMFKWRHRYSFFVKSLCVTLLFLHITMDGPVWSLFTKTSVIVPGSTGWHRFHLIDQGIKRFSEWAILGTRSTAHWGYGCEDVTNQYLLEGVRGGFMTLALFVAILVVAMKTSVKFSLCSVPRDVSWLSWGVCISIAAHCVGFFGNSYFGQIQMLLYLHFAFAGFIYEVAANHSAELIFAG